MKKILSITLSVIAILSINACNNSEAAKQTSGSRTLNVNAYVIEPEAFSNELTTTADLMAEEQVEIMAPISAQVLAIYFKEGEQVKKGQKIIRLDDRNWKAQLVGVKAELVAVKKDYDRKKQLLNVEGSSQEEVDNAFSKMEMLKSDVQQLQVNIDLANVVAPFAGQLGLRDFSEGAFLRQGDPITTLSANNQLKIGFTVSQTHAKSIEMGKKVLIVVDSDTLEAKIYAISPIIDVQTRTLKVRARLSQERKKNIRPGAFAEVLITTELMEDAILIPTQAVVPSINEQTVFLSKNGKAVRQVVTIGNRTANKVHVLTGLNEGDTVITTGLLSVKDGMGISIQSIN